MKHIKLFEEWSNEVNEAIPSNILAQLSYLSSDSDIKNLEQEIQQSIGNNAEITIEKKPVNSMSLDDKSMEDKVKGNLEPGIQSVVLLNVKKDGNTTPSTFVIPQRKEKLKLDGSIKLPTLLLGQNDTLDININGLKSVLNDIAKDKEDVLSRFSPKLTLKHTL